MAKKTKRLSLNDTRMFIISDETDFMIKEAYKTARTNLTFSLATYDPKIAIVTSCSPAEGKSMTCVNIAITMAEMGKPVLLIDADMRKPVQNQFLKIDNKIGLSSILGGIVDDIEKVISENVRKNLDVITSGPIPPNPAELLASARMDKLLKLLGERYYYIFIDTPPINIVSDALVMNDKVSGIVFVVKEGSTTHPEIKEAIDKTKMTNGKILGIIKSSCSYKGKSSYGSYRYKYSHF